jgi:hypothetical protein
MSLLTTTFYFRPVVFNANPIEFANSRDLCKLHLYADGVKRGDDIIKCRGFKWIYNENDYVAIKISQWAPQPVHVIVGQGFGG